MAFHTEGAARIRRLRLEKEFLVGLLAIVAIILMFVFGWLMGVLGPLTKDMEFHVLYDFAGGVEVGSPVRVSGVKVGRVEKIRFLSLGEVSGQEDVTLKVTISVSTKAAPAVREDSQFYINMAGIIGERYIEISPGSLSLKALDAGSTVRGEDPPRIDQLLSQGYGVFGKVQDFLEENKKTLTEFLEQFQRLLGEANKVMKRSDGKKLITLVDNFVAISTDLKKFTHSLSEKKAEKFFQQLVEIMNRVHEIDKQTLKDFLQEEGIRARIF